MKEDTFFAWCDRVKPFVRYPREEAERIVRQELARRFPNKKVEDLTKHE